MRVRNILFLVTGITLSAGAFLLYYWYQENLNSQQIEVVVDYEDVLREFQDNESFYIAGKYFLALAARDYVLAESLIRQSPRSIFPDPVETHRYFLFGDSRPHLANIVSIEEFSEGATSSDAVGFRYLEKDFEDLSNIKGVVLRHVPKNSFFGIAADIPIYLGKDSKDQWTILIPSVLSTTVPF